MSVTFPSFSRILAAAEIQKGGRKAVMSQLPPVASNAQLMASDDAYYLSEMSRRIFRAGLKHKMVDDRWPAFTEVFLGFDPLQVAMMSDEVLEGLAKDTRIIRHFGKIKAVRKNALWIRDISVQHGSFGTFLAGWPGERIVDLWLLMKKEAAQLGGMSGPRFLRMVGKDTFLLTEDVVSVLRSQGVIDKLPTSKRDLHHVQAAFNHWVGDTGMSLSALSRIVSYTTLSEGPI